MAGFNAYFLLVIAMSYILVAVSVTTDNSLNVPQNTKDLIEPASSNLGKIQQRTDVVQQRMSLRGRKLEDSNSVDSVVKTLQSINQLINTFRSVMLDGGFDISVLQRAAQLTESRSNLFQMVVGGEGRAFTNDLNQAIQQLMDTEVLIRSLAQTIIGNTRNLNTLLQIDESADTGSIGEEQNIDMLKAALNLLSTSLETFERDAQAAVRAFTNLGDTSVRLNSRSLTMSRSFAQAGQDNSRQLREAEERLRSEAYGTCAGICTATCAASVLTLFFAPAICGGCIGACFGPAAGIVEGQQIPALRNSFLETSRALNDFQNTFETFSGVSISLGNRITQDISLLDRARSDFAVAENLLTATSNAASSTPALLTLVPVLGTVQQNLKSIEDAADLLIRRFVGSRSSRRLDMISTSRTASMRLELEQHILESSILINAVNFKVEYAYWNAVKNANIAQGMIDKINTQRENSENNETKI